MNANYFKTSVTRTEYIDIREIFCCSCCFFLNPNPALLD